MQLSRVLNPKDIITIFYVEDFMATTVKRVWEITGKIGDRYTVKEKGKRKQYYLNLNPESIIFDGAVPVSSDTEFNCFQGNACLNLVAESEEVLKGLIKEKALNIIHPKTLGSILFYPLVKMEMGEPFDGAVLYPEDADVSHSVVQSLLEK